MPVAAPLADRDCSPVDWLQHFPVPVVANAMPVVALGRFPGRHRALHTVAKRRCRPGIFKLVAVFTDDSSSKLHCRLYYWLAPPVTAEHCHAGREHHCWSRDLKNWLQQLTTTIVANAIAGCSIGLALVATVAAFVDAGCSSAGDRFQLLLMAVAALLEHQS